MSKDEQVETVAPYGSDEYFAAWDAADADELAAAIDAWGTGEGTAESPWHPIPDDEMIATIRAHEASGEDRPAVLAAIDAKAATSAEPEAEPESKPDQPEPDAATAPYGWDVVGKDGRRIVRGQTEPAARAFAADLKAKTGERLKVKPSTAPLLGPAADNT